MSNENWISVDLHVHTPASKDYKGDRGDEEYKSIIKKASEFGKHSKKEETPSKRMVAITDHNTIKGYERILELKGETLQLQRLLRTRDLDSNLIKSLDEEEEIFRKIAFIPGVEIKPDPGIHLLVLFHEKTDLGEINNFLKDGLNGGLEGKEGSPDPMLIWSIAQTFEEISNRFGNKAIVVAPHADSSSGIYESLKNLSQARISAFTNDLLKAISFNNIDNKAKMEGLLSKPEYKRAQKLSFIQSSDYHGQAGLEIGYLHSRIRFRENRVNFEGLVKAIAKQENVKCSVDFIKDTYNELTEGYIVKSFTSYDQSKISLSKEDYRDFTDTVCAFLNTSGGIVEIAASIDEEKKEELLELFQVDIKNILSESLEPDNISFGIKTLKYTSSKTKLLLLFKKSNMLYTSDGKVIILKGKSPCPANSSEIEYVVSNNLSNKYGVENENILERITNIANIISKAHSSYPILIKSRKSIQKNIEKIFNIDSLENDNKVDSISKQINLNSLGNPSGEVNVVFDRLSARLDDSYVRFSAPMFEVDEEIIKNTSLIDEDSIIITPIGAAYYVEKGKYLHKGLPVTKLNLKTEGKILPWLAWFKSSFFIWYCLFVLKSKDTFFLFMSDSRNVPYLVHEDDEIINSLNTYSNNIIIEEKNFLKTIQKLMTKKEENSNAIDSLIIKHNATMNKDCLNIDYQIFKTIGLNRKEIKMIYKNLKDVGVYDYGFSENAEFIEKIKDLDGTEVCNT